MSVASALRWVCASLQETSIKTESIPIQSVSEMADSLLEGITRPHHFLVGDSEIPGAGFGLFAHEDIPAGVEIFRAMPVVSAV